MAKKSSRPSTPAELAQKRERISKKRKSGRAGLPVTEEGYVNPKSAKQLRAQKTAEKEAGENRLEGISPNELTGIERAGRRGRSTVTGRSARDEAMADMRASGFGVKSSDEELEEAAWKESKGSNEPTVVVKRDSRGKRVGTVEGAGARGQKRFIAFGSSKEMSPADTADFLNDNKEFHNSTGERREAARKRIHTSLRRAGLPSVAEATRIPCAVPNCNSRDVTIHPTVGGAEWKGVGGDLRGGAKIADTMYADANKTGTYRCSVHESKPEVPDLWDMQGEEESKNNEKQRGKVVGTGTKKTAKVK